MFFNFSLSGKEYLRIYGCLASDMYSDYARTLHHILSTSVKDIYEDNSYPKCREIFETKIEDYFYQKLKSIGRLWFIADDFCSGEGIKWLVFLIYHVEFL